MPSQNMSSELRRKIFGYIELAGVLGVAVWWYFDSRAGFWPGLVCLVLWGAGILGRALGWWDYKIGSPFDIPLLALLLTGAIALWATYPTAASLKGFPIPVGQDKFWLIIGSVLVFYTLARLPDLRSIQAAIALSGLLSAVISVYFLLSNDFTNQPEKFYFIHQIGLFIQRVQPHLNLPAPAPNWAGGLAAVFIPGVLESIRVGYRLLTRGKRIIFILASSVILGISGLCILLSSSRGAWIALFIGLSLWAGIWFLDRMAVRSGTDRKVWDRTLAIILVVVAGAAVIGSLLFGSRILSFFPPLAQNASYIPRPELQENAILLVKDYPFTGSGLGTFPAVFSIYTLLIYVPAIIDAHNLLLDLAISQGIPGLIAWLVVLLGTISLAWQTRINHDQKYRLPLGCACVMLVVMLVHGLVEDPYYDSRAVILWLVPAGLILAQARLVETREKPFTRKTGIFSAGVVLGSAVLILAGIVVLPSWRAAYLANLGAVSQTRVELSSYDPDHFDNPTLDTVRRQVDLSQAEGYFTQALQRNPGQITALQRLAEIALSRKEYTQALAWMQQAAPLDPGNRVTRLLLGDALVANGRPDEAVVLDDGLPFAKGRLSGQGWYRYHLDGDLTREKWANLADQAIK